MVRYAGVGCDDGGFTRIVTKKAIAAGLTFRPLEETARDTLAWFKTLPADRQANLRAGLTRAREREALDAWHRKQGYARDCSG